MPWIAITADLLNAVQSLLRYLRRPQDDRPPLGQVRRRLKRRERAEQDEVRRQLRLHSPVSAAYSRLAKVVGEIGRQFACVRAGHEAPRLCTGKRRNEQERPQRMISPG